MTETVISKTTVSDGHNGSGQIVQLTDYTVNSTVKVYLNNKLLASDEYEILYSNDNGGYVLYLQEVLQEVPIGSAINVHIINSDTEDEGNNADDIDLSIYVPTDYSSVADIPADLKKMAKSIQKIFDDIKSKIGDKENDSTNHVTIEMLNQAISNIDLSEYVTRDDVNRLQIIEMTEVEVTILPNLYYVWGEMEELSITLGESNNDGYTDEYCFEFRSGAIPTMLIFDNNIKWVSEPNIEANKTYQVSILNGLGVIAGV